ncbi:MAG: molybdopterin-dependent oxidoreductase [Coriobacteriia bacterium]
MSEISTHYKTLGFCSGGAGSVSAEVDVKDGKILRIRPAQYDKCYTSEQMRAWTYDVNGAQFKAAMKTEISPLQLAYKKRVYSPNRIPYPLKRVDWDPNGERNPQNRGVSKYARISWDEATDIIASEIRRIEAEYGLNSVLLQIDGHGESKAIHGPHGIPSRLFRYLGGNYTYQVRQPDSWEGWFWGAKHVWGQEPVGQGEQSNLFWDIAHNTKNLLVWGGDPETTTWGWSGQQSSNVSYWFTECGVKQIYVCPDLNYGAGIHADRWIPVLPNTDLALQFAIAYVWLTEGTYDREYLDTHAIGFEHLERVIAGEEDGIPKTPEWAEPICGVPVRIIKALARKWAKEATSTAHCNGGSYIRAAYAHEPARMEVCLLAMQGLGKPGQNQLKFIDKYLCGLHTQNPAPRAGKFISTWGCSHQWPYFPESESSIPKSLVQTALAGDWTDEHPLTWYGWPICIARTEDQFVPHQYPLPGSKPIHMIWSDTPCWTTCWNGGNEFIKGLRDDRIEFVLIQHPWMENDCLFADILLPINTKFEEEDLSADTMTGNFLVMYYESQAIEPVGESMSDWEAVGEVAKKLGVYEEFSEGKSNADWIQAGYQMSGCAEDLPFDEFLKNEYYVVPTAEGWEQDPAGFYNFYTDPEKYPLTTPSGKLEIYSERLATSFPDDEERKPYPQYIDDGESYHESLRHARAEKYPFLIVSNHPRWRIHANHDDVSWLREIQTNKVIGPDGYKYQTVWINPSDAKNLGVATGDVVRIYNERGWVLGGVYVTERIMPGVVSQDHGARLDPIENGVSDRSGANNLIAPSNCTSKNAAGEVTSGFLVGVEKVDVLALAKQYPVVFGREYDPNVGLSFDNWIVKKED